MSFAVFIVFQRWQRLHSPDGMLDSSFRLFQMHDTTLFNILAGFMYLSRDCSGIDLHCDLAELLVRVVAIGRDTNGVETERIKFSLRKLRRLFLSKGYLWSRNIDKDRRTS